MRSRTRRQVLGRSAAALLAAGGLLVALPGAAAGQTADPRQGLTAASNPNSPSASTPLVDDAGRVASGLTELASTRTADWGNGITPLGGSVNSDLAFFGDHAVEGNYSGFSIYDVKDPTKPTRRTSVTCPGSQNDVSVYGDLLFLSVEATNARIDCRPAVAGQSAAEVFRGVRIFDISDVDDPQQLPGVQTCRGSHTHTVVTKPGVTDKIWIYVSGTSSIRSATSLAGCSAGSSLSDPNTANFRIDVIEVPLAAPETAKVVSNPRIFSKCGSSACESDYATTEQHPDPRYGTRGTLNWLSGSGAQPTYPAGDERAPGGQSVAQSLACHDITAYPAIGLAAGACQGDGLLLDISDPVHPVRIDNVTDFNFAYWHSATFNDDGTKVVFTDEWGGGSAARCQAGQNEHWGVDAIFDVVQTPSGPELEFASYFGIPKVQSAQENCVAHNGSLVPVPGRDVMVQAWYQGGLSVWDFTDSQNPVEIAYFDRGPVTSSGLVTGGFWSTYWNNGSIVGSEIRLGLDTFDLTASALTANQLAAAKAVRTTVNNVQHQQKTTWPASFTTVRGFADSALQTGALTATESAEVRRFVDRAEGFATRNNRTSAKATLNAKAGELLTPAQQPLAEALRDLAGSL